MKDNKITDKEKWTKEVVDALFRISEIVGPIMDKKEKDLKNKLKKYYAKKIKKTCPGY